MPIIRWKPFLEPFEEFDKFFKVFAPAIDVYEKKGKIIAETPIAGIEPEKIDIFIEDDILTIKGKTEKKSEVEDKNYYRKEVRYGSFYRSVTLPTRVLGDKAQATYADGVLRIEIPKAVEEKKKKKLIPIKIKKGLAKKVKAKKK
jgi:HSP20 family protein